MHLHAQGFLLMASKVSTNNGQRIIEYKITDAADNTFCYDIYINGRLLIHQPTKPGLPGKNGFIRKIDAEKVAKLVVKKIERGIMPPTVELKELDSLKIKY